MASPFPLFELGEGFADLEHPTPAQLETCKQLAEELRRSGILLIKDPRVDAARNEAFLDLMEEYFSQSDELKQPDIREDLSFQVGLTPSGVEMPRVLQDTELQSELQGLPPANSAALPDGPDVKCRFMWRCGSRPLATQFPELNADPVIPQAFPQWADVMNSFGDSMLAVANTVARCAAIGFGLPAATLVAAMTHGPHLLAPTGSDLSRHGDKGTVLAGYHSDLNFLTLHGKSRFPGLYVWTADGSRLPVKVPEGCLLCQAGQQMEWMTGGFVKAGRHEVIVSDATLEAIAAARASGRSLWRVSSTLFTHIASDVLLQPQGRFATPDSVAKYPPVPAGQQVERELQAISLLGGRGPCYTKGSGQPGQRHAEVCCFAGSELV